MHYVLLIACYAGWTLLAMATAGPVPPCGDSNAPTEPPFGARNAQPELTVWRDIELRLPASCPGESVGRFALVVALASRFESSESVTGMASRVGAVSAMGGLRYWSVTDERWSPLFTEVFAVQDLPGAVARADFSATEVLDGATLLFSQSDSRSSGHNIYRLRAIQVSADTLVIESWNVTPVKLMFLTLFEAHTLRSVHYLRRESAASWSYYGLSLVRSGGTLVSERSIINRAVSYYRYLAGQPSDGAPPLAP